MDRRGFLASGAAALAAPAMAQSATPATPSAAARIPVSRLADLEAQAHAALGDGPFAFVAGGSGAEWTLRENRRAFDRWAIIPEYLSGRGPPDLRIKLLGADLQLPVFTCPTGGQGVVHASADVGMAEGTAAAGALMTCSGASSRSLEEVAAATPGPKWYQLYMPADPGRARSVLQRAKAAGYRAVVFTIDALAAGNSESLDRSGYDLGGALRRMPPQVPATPAGTPPGTRRTLSWDDLTFVQKESGLPVILKGVLTPQQARRAVQMGAVAVQVSNHGGRQLDGLPAALDVLPEIVAAVGGKATVLMDSGIRRGVDVFKALALGADAVGLGRPALYGLALGGNLGVQSVYERLKSELSATMQSAGVDRIDQITETRLRKVA
jgi:isopentenyl diphosphate isomerase/L-lactate dehydrogenase-like FMN-dependent dehydrogenase